MNSSRRRAAIPLVAALSLFAGCAGGPPAEPQAARAKNVILFIGDGMGVSTVTAMRIYDGQSRGATGEENVLSFERFPNVGLVKTYNTNQQVPDSAGTATAMNTGIKTRAGVIGIGPSSRRRNCEEARAAELVTIADIARANGKDYGIVTTTRITHATPATVYAHSPERDWEADTYLTDANRADGCVDIARQFVELPAELAPVITLGGGWREFKPASERGKRKDGADLIAAWQAADPRRQYIRTARQLDAMSTDGPVLGLFSRSHMPYESLRDADSTLPGIVDMTTAAIDYLERRDKGYYLMIEGGRIDHGHHDGKPGLALSEGQAFARAVAAAIERVDLDETLVIVTADHSHVFTLAGYPTRGNDILGLVISNDRSGEPETEPVLGGDGKPYTTVGYANGPGAVRGERPTPETGRAAIAQALVPIEYTTISGDIGHDETHGGEDVAIYAIGPGSDAVRGVIEQNRIFDIMTDAFGFPR